jgi:hypothetical protein
MGDHHHNAGSLASNAEASEAPRRRYRGVRQRPYGGGDPGPAQGGACLAVEAGARAYDDASRRFRGSRAKLNFPEDARHHPATASES